VTRAPFYRKCGVPVNGKQPLAFMHECWVDGCEASAPFGFEVRLREGHPGKWACAEHRNGLLTSVADTASTNEGGKNVEGNAAGAGAAGDDVEYGTTGTLW
jgi:hypothetical protein